MVEQSKSKSNTLQVFGVGTGYNGILLHEDKECDWVNFKQIEDFEQKFESENEQNISEDQDQWFKIYSGTKHYDKELFIWGEHIYHGTNGKEVSQNIPQNISIDFKISKLSLGFEHTLILTEDHQVFAFGKNSVGQLGQDPKLVKYQEKPVLVEFKDSNKIVDIYTGLKSSFLILENGQVYSLGSNKHFELGLNSKQFDSPPQENSKSQPNTIISPTLLDFKISQISSGMKHTVFLSNCGKLIYGCGSNKMGQLGYIDFDDKNECQIMTQLPIDQSLIDSQEVIIEKVVCGWSNTLILYRNKETENRELWIVGSNHYGQLGQGEKLKDLKFSNKWHQVGENLNIQDVYAQSEAFIIKTKENQLYSWGWNEHGNLALGDKIDRHEPTLIENLPFEIDQNSEIHTQGAYMFLVNKQRQ
eukprot:403364780